MQLLFICLLIPTLVGCNALRDYRNDRHLDRQADRLPGARPSLSGTGPSLGGNTPSLGGETISLGGSAPALGPINDP